MQKSFLIFLFLLVSIPFLLLAISSKYNVNIISPLTKEGLIVKEKPLEKYTFSRLRQTEFPASNLSLGKVLYEDALLVSRIFYFTVDGKKVSGLINMPQKKGIYPVIVMFRGYVDQKKYTIGEGTRHTGEVFAQKGYITLAPDFLGYGESDKPSTDSIEERFQTHTTALTLLASVKNLNQALESSDSKADTEKIGIWGHSNGGQITLSILAMSGKPYPTVIWAPVTKPFPYSVLYYTDEFDDHGKALRRVVANFEKDYDIENYSLTNYLSWIAAPIQFHQGGADEAVPQKWSDEFVATLKTLKKDIAYFTYPGDDHNLAKGSWSTAVLRSISFYKEQFAQN